MNSAQPLVTSTATADHFTWGAGCDGWHLVRTEALSVIQERMPPGTEEAWHYHERARQFFFVLAGEATMEVAGTVYRLGPLQGIEIAPGVPHQLRNEAGQDLIFTVTSTPKSHGDRINV